MRNLILFGFLIAATQALEYGAFVKKNCSRLEFGHRVYDVLVIDANVGEMECLNTFTNVGGFVQRPRRCWKTDAGEIVAEFHVPDNDCTPFWSNVTDAGCSLEMDGVRMYRAQLAQLKTAHDYREACAEIRAYLPGVFSALLPSRCHYDDVVTGEFHVKDKSCLADDDEALKCGEDYVFVCIERDGIFLSMKPWGDICSTRSCGAREKFQLAFIPEEKFSFRNVATGLYLSVSPDGKLESSNILTDHELFEIDFPIDNNRFNAKSHLGTYLAVQNRRWTTANAQLLNKYDIKPEDE